MQQSTPDKDDDSEYTRSPTQDEEQLPSLEELANIQFSLPFNPKDYAKPFFYGGLGLFTVGLAAGTVVSGVTKPPPPEEKATESVMAARAEGFRLVRISIYGVWGVC